ncbi:tail protein X [Kaistia adipata]|uniref:tail protein X n=1 Tax=Kaistia adipata TaxID=166954 RepID=UPI0003FD03AB|nr:tail protein X [Kaistia adipata]
MAIYITRQGDMIDAICTRAYGDESGYVEIVLDANPGLAALGVPLPIGTVIDLPEIANAKDVVAVVSLWD